MTHATTTTTTAIHEQLIGAERLITLPGMTLVASASEPGAWHRVEHDACTCKSYTYRGRCRHLDAAREAARPVAPAPMVLRTPDGEDLALCTRCSQYRRLLHGTRTCALCLATPPLD